MGLHRAAGESRGGKDQAEQPAAALRDSGQRFAAKFGGAWVQGDDSSAFTATPYMA
jgi:hypothetical protein